MAYTPHTERDIATMLDAIGAKSIDDLFADVPERIRLAQAPDIPSLDEYALTRWFETAAAENRTAQPGRLFLGAGAYSHYTPAAVKNLIDRGEFVTCYTPYQAEVSQGTLQAIYEFQSHICALTGLEVANASMYDGATALAEALTLAVRHTNRNLVCLPETLHPHYLAVCETFLREIDVEIRLLASKDGEADYGAEAREAAAVVVQTPNFHGVLEDGTAARRFADACGALLVAVCNPTALAVLSPPGEWGADIAVGEAQPLGIPLQYGGPYAGYFSCTQKLVRKMPGRISGKTTDAEGREGYVLTLQTREQHIRRERATSNICTNQGLFALMATMYLTFAGKRGLVEVAETCAARAHALAGRLVAETGASMKHDKPFFHEFALALPVRAADFLRAMRDDHDIVAGFDLGRTGAANERDVLVCTTELNTPADIDAYVAAAKSVLAGNLAGAARS